jgi:mRNA interferase RelE/StbE
MHYEIIFSPEAIQDIRDLKANVSATVRDAIEVHLRHEPTKISKSRIKRLRGLSQPQYRLRVGEIRVFYDVIEEEVQILAIIPKSKTEDWLKNVGESDNGSSI